jgi:hypothetical protein
MKIRSLIFAVLITLSLVGLKFASANQDPNSAGRTIQISPERILTSISYYPGEEVRLFLEGQYPSSCYRPGEDRVQVNKDSGEIYLDHYAFLSPDTSCADVPTPYTHLVALGVLPAGKYRVLIRNLRDGSYRYGASFVVSDS